jgi:pimeloyl-ACP methyl ester carboxylesterase
MQIAVASCYADVPTDENKYKPVELSGQMSQAGIAFHRNSKAKICKDLIPNDVLAPGLLIFTDTSIVDEESASAFKPKSYLSILTSRCKMKELGGAVCGFSVESAYGIRVVSATKDLQNIFFIHNRNRFLQVRVDSHGDPYLIADKEISVALADSISGQGVARYGDIDEEINRIHLKYLQAKSKSPELDVYAFSVSENNNVYIMSKKKDKKVYILADDRILNTNLTTSDINNPSLRQDGVIYSDGFIIRIGTRIVTEDVPFVLSSGLKENRLTNSASLITRNISFKRSLQGRNTYDFWSLENRPVESRCENLFDKKIHAFRIGETHFKRINSAFHPANKTILYFFGGPAGQFSNDHYSEALNRFIDKSYNIVIPYYGGSIGAGFDTSKRFSMDHNASVEKDASNINEYLSGTHKVDIVAYSFGAVAAINFASRYPEKVNKLILVAPYAKHRDPSEYRTTPQSIAYQRALENSWFGVESDQARPKLNAFLKDSYSKLAKSGVEVHYIFGEVDAVSKVEDISERVKSASSSISVIKADHQLVTVHPDTNHMIFSILGI